MVPPQVGGGGHVGAGLGAGGGHVGAGAGEHQLLPQLNRLPKQLDQLLQLPEL